MKNETKKRIRRVSWILFVLYIMLLIYCLFISEGFGRKNFFELRYRYNLVPFQEIQRFWVHRKKVGNQIAFMNIAGNVIGFLPYGFLLPILNRRFRNIWLAGLMGFGFSLSVETIQLVFRVGCFDVDDLILNTLGTVLGYCMFLICNWLRRIFYEKTV
ncbi:MAG: VanZ family protein [Oliverpabstia sp.]